jgi:hypothetical protein
MIRQIFSDDHIELKKFFSLANFSNDHRSDTFDMALHYLITDEYYRGFANFINDEIVSVCFMRELTMQKAQVLDFIATKKGVSIRTNRVGEVVDYAIKFGEAKGIYRFYTFLTEEMLDTVDVLKKKNLVFTWRERYDTYIDEVIESRHLSIYYIHWTYIMNSTLRSHRKIVRHHHLKPEYYSITKVSESI